MRRKSKDRNESRRKLLGTDGDLSVSKKQAYVLSYARRVALMYAVYRFMVHWDPELIRPQKGRSNLAAQSVFPTGLKSRDELKIRELFGFSVPERSN